MFTGIIDHCGQILSIERHDSNYRLTISSHFDDLQLGESIAVDGACLTVTASTQQSFSADISPETMRLTLASQYQPGMQVNLERSLRLSDRLGGHFVMGHVDGMGILTRREPTGEFIVFEISQIPSDCQPYLTTKGSIAVNGVSLTLNEVSKNKVKLMLVPHTLAKTNLSLLQEGDKINIEFDYLAKLVINQLGFEKS
jgi:riboflavin synthase